MNSTIQIIFSISSSQNSMNTRNTINRSIIKPYNSCNKNINSFQITLKIKRCSIKIYIFITSMKKKTILQDLLTASSWNGMMSYCLSISLIMKKLKKIVCLSKLSLSMNKAMLMDLIYSILVSSLISTLIDQKFQT